MQKQLAAHAEQIGELERRLNQAEKRIELLVNDAVRNLQLIKLVAMDAAVALEQLNAVRDGEGLLPESHYKSTIAERVNKTLEYTGDITVEDDGSPVPFGG